MGRLLTSAVSLGFGTSTTHIMIVLNHPELLFVLSAFEQIA